MIALGLVAVLALGAVPDVAPAANPPLPPGASVGSVGSVGPVGPVGPVGSVGPVRPGPAAPAQSTPLDPGPAATTPATPLGPGPAAVTPVAPLGPSPAERAPAVVTPLSAVGPDLELHVPRADVAKLSLDVENLNAKLDVDTSVAQLVHIQAGVVATVEKLKAELEGVSAETHLVVRLDRVSEIMQHALGVIDENPQLSGGPVAPAPAAAPPAAGVAADATAGPRPVPTQSRTE